MKIAKESKLWGAVMDHDAWPYARTDGQVRFPRSLGAFGHAVLQPGTTGRTNCCCLAEYVARFGWDLPWSLDLHKLFTIQTSDRFGPVTAALQLKIGEPATLGSFRGSRWFLCQGWRKDGGGHSFFLQEHHEPTDRVLFVEANLWPKPNAGGAGGLDGVGSRGSGPTSMYVGGHPGRDWWRRRTLWTLADVAKEYPEIRCARLGVEVEAVRPWEV